MAASAAGAAIGWTIFALVLLAILVYVLFSKHCLPIWCARPVARVYFWPTLPFTIMTGKGWCGGGTRKLHWHRIDDRVWVGAVPVVCMGHLEQFSRPPMNIRAVVNMCDEYEGPVDEYQSMGIEQLRLPTVDHIEPSATDLWNGCQWIESQLRNMGGNTNIYIHCKGGHGRGAAMAFAWLLYSDPNADLESVQTKLLTIRKVRKRLYQQVNISMFWHQLQQKRQGGAAAAAVDAWAIPRGADHTTDSKKVNSSGYGQVD